MTQPPEGTVTVGSGSRGGATAFVLTAAEIAAATEGHLVRGDAARPVATFSIDSRTLRPGDLFIALRGERFDGHAFVDAALHRGACGVMVGQWDGGLPSSGPEPIVVVVPDTLQALQRLGRFVRRRSQARVVAITGSAGKTTTKETTASLLEARYRVYRNRGNLNNHIGLPLSLLDLTSCPDVAVVELGMNHPGEIRTLVSVAEPEMRVWTNVAEVHAAFFPSIEAIADAKAEILEAATATTSLVANANDARVMARLTHFPGCVTTFGLETAADVSAWEIADLGLEGTAARVRTPEGEAQLRTPLLGRGNLANVLAAMAVAGRFGIGLADMVARVARLRPADHRGEIVRLPGGLVVVDDSYNSNPLALARALEVLEHDRSGARRVAVVGEMVELGDRALALHEACGRTAARVGLAALVTVGGVPARALGAAAVAAGLPLEALRHAATSEEAAALVAGLVRPGDVVLVKGSRSVRTDRVVERLKAEYA